MFPKIKKFSSDVILGATTLATGGISAWRDFLEEQKAQTGTIMAIVTGAITVLLGVIIFANVKNAMPPVADDAANTTMTTVGNIFYSAVGLVVIGFLVLAAVFIREWVLKPFPEETRCCIQTPRRWGRLNIGFALLPVIEMR